MKSSGILLSIRDRQIIVMVNAINFAGNEPPNKQTLSETNVHIWSACCQPSHSGGTGTSIYTTNDINAAALFCFLFCSSSALRLYFHIVFEAFCWLWSLFFLGFWCVQIDFS